MTALLTQRAAALRAGPVTAIAVTGDGFAATTAAARALAAAPPDPAQGVLTWAHPYGGSVAEGRRTVVAVVLVDALVEAEDLDADPAGTTWVRVFAVDPDRRAALAAAARAALGAAAQP